MQAVVTRRGIPLLNKDVASFRAPRQTPPARIRALRVRRSRSSLLVAFSPSRGASRYAISAQLSDGRKLAFDLPSRCRALRIGRVPRTVGGKIRIAGVRYDLVAGHLRSLSIRGKARSAGPRLPRHFKIGRVCR